MKRTDPATQSHWRVLPAVAIVSMLGSTAASTSTQPAESLHQAAALPSRSGSRDADEAAIRGLVDRIGDGWQAADPDGVAAVFAEDGVLVAGEGSHRSGRSEIAQFMRQVFAGMPKGMRLTTQFKSLRFLRPDVALLHTEGGFLMPGETQLPAERLGIQSFVVTRQSRVWQIALFQNTRIQVQAYESK